MERILEIIYSTIKVIISVVAFTIELPIKVISVILFLVLYVILASFAPWLNNRTCPTWWDIWVEYNKRPLYFVLLKWVIKNY